MTTGTPTLGLWLKWMVTFLGFPIGGGVAYLLVRSMEGIAKPTIGGLVTGLVLGVAQWIVLRQVMALSGWWIVATGIGLAAGLALSVALSGTSIELRPLIVRAVLTGCLLGIVADIGLSRGEVGPWAGMFGGATFPWTLGVSALLGVWLMASPDIFKSVGGAADSDHLLGALVVVVAITAMAEVGRAFRFFNILLAVAIVVAPWVLSGAPFVARLNDLAAGVLLIALSLPRGKIQNRYGGCNPFIL